MPWLPPAFVRRTLRCLSVGLVFLALFYVQTAYHARQDFARAEDAYTRGDYPLALTYYERTIHGYTPGSAVVQRAVARTWQLGTEAESRGDASLALEAYQILRSSLYAVRSFYVPYYAWVVDSEARIAQLMAQRKGGPTAEATQLAHDTARYTAMFQRQMGPTVVGSMLVELGFLGWVGAAIAFIWCAVDHQGRLVWQRSLWWGSAVVAFFALWVISLRWA